MNGIYRIAKVHRLGPDSNLEILVQKIKVKKLDFNLYFLEMNSDFIRSYTTEWRQIIPFY